MGRRNLRSEVRSAGSSRRVRSREYFQKRPLGIVEPVVYPVVVKPVVVESVRVPVPRPVPCPVCLHDDPGDLEWHLRSYHSREDMRAVFMSRLGPVLPRSLRLLLKSGDRGMVSRVLAGYVTTGFLQVPRFTATPRQVTRVLWRAGSQD